MWNEPSQNASELRTNVNSSSEPLAAKVASVELGAIGDELGFEVGDKIISINGIKPRDLIDFRYLITDEELSLD